LPISCFDQSQTRKTKATGKKEDVDDDDTTDDGYSE